MAGDTDERYMRSALRLALKAAGRTSPNPMVGAVLVRKGRIIATGYHRRAGEDHAEIIALKNAGRRARGATLYINLEPCDHLGKTPPCTSSLIRAGVRKVVAGMVDPNPLVSGRGVRRLRRAGVQVEIGLLEAECRKLNEAFVKYVTRGIPFVILKLAATADGKIATSTGDSKWITGEAARRYVHQLRNQVDAVVVGRGTVTEDDPLLTCRIPGGRDPWRVVLDGRLRTPLTAQLVQPALARRTIIATGPGVAEKKVKLLRERGAQVWSFPLRRGGLPFKSVLRRLGKMGLLSVMIEGGASTASRALMEKAVDKVVFFYAPKIIGGDGKSMLASLGTRKLSASRRISKVELLRLGEDVAISGYL
jgi:diaminohydroxyphosphoribosylaminopyrimidine deaminase/5-amino-6-(5-phosphoribosylamino)uracil reductase